MCEDFTKLEKQVLLLEQRKYEPIAIIGMGCRFPGGADNPRAFWRLLHEGVDAISEVPKNRWDVDAYYHPNPDTPGKMCTRHGGFLDGVDQFAPHFFNISPREALSLDPQQRLLLEVTWEALEHANIIPENLYGSPTGVFVGISNSDYVGSTLAELQNDIIERIDAYFCTGSAFCAAAGRLSYFLRLTGPNMAIDTACSSSLVALHLACQSLRQNECDLALVGGANLVLSPMVNIVFTKARMLAPDGRCKTFDAAADGYARGEGCGILVIKRLSEALRDGDSILALVRSSAINQDGPSSGLTVPSGPSQEAVIHHALENAGLTAAAIDYIEAHGTGTYLGDPIEAGALSEVYGHSRPPERPLYVGSVKTNIGHLESAAGVASIIKTVLALQHREIPQHLHFKRLNPHIPWDGLPIIVPTERIPWKSDEIRRAGISGFGFSGTNVHVILEEAPQTPEPPLQQNSMERPLHLLTLTARSEAELEAMTARYAQFLDDQPNLDYADVCYTANTCRARFDHRLGVTAASAEAASQVLTSFGTGEPAQSAIHGRRSLTGRPKIAFLFTGQGGQYVNMGRQLYETQPAFRKTMEQCNEILRPYLERPLLSVLYPETLPCSDADLQQPDNRSDIHSTAYTQPALFALECALAELWRSWGIQPDIVLGHSVGDYAAACVAGVFDLADGLKLIAERARLIQELPQNGCMAAVFADPVRIMPAMLPYQEQASIATFNSPENVVISGEQEAVEAIVRSLAAEGIQSQLLEVSHAFHSHLMDPILDDFEHFASQVAFSRAQIKLVSNLYGNLTVGDEVASPTYWRDHIRKPVRFTDGMARLIEQGCQVFVEIGPHPILLGIARQCLSGEAARQASGWHWLPSLRRDREPWQQLLLSLGELFVAGMEIDWHAYERDYTPGRQRVALPTYPFQRERYWLNMKLDESGQPTLINNSDQHDRTHPLLGKRLSVAGSDALHFESSIGINTPPILGDHRILGKAFVPGALFLEVALAAGAVYFESEKLVLEDALIEEMLVLPEDSRITLQTKLVPEDDHSASFQVFSQPNPGKSGSDWIRHGSGRITCSAASPPLEPIDIASLTGPLDLINGSPEAFYFSCQMMGFNYGPSFQTIQYLHNPSPAESGEIIGRVGLPERLLHEATVYQIHPALLDGCFQLAIAALDQKDTLSLPVQLKRLELYRPHPSQVWVYAKAHPSEDVDEDASMVSIRLYDANGSPVAEVEGVAKKVDRRKLMRALYGNPSNWMYKILWEPHPSGTASQPASADPGRNWLILADQGGLGIQLAERLRARGEYCTLVSSSTASGGNHADTYRIDPLQPQAYVHLLEKLRAEGNFPLHGVIHLWALDATSTGDAPLKRIEQNQALVCGSALHLAQALVSETDGRWPRLWLVTEGAQAVQGIDGSITADQSTLWGLGRVIATEHPELRCARIDLDVDDKKGNVRNLFDTIWSSEREDQLAYRQGNRYVARLARLSTKADMPPGHPPEENYKVAISNYGILDNLVLGPGERKPPGPGEVEIAVRAAGLNFRDVLNALGMLKEFSKELGIESAAELPFGSECAGIIVAVGEGVEDLQVGDEVIAGLAIGSMANYITVRVETLIHKPPDMSFEEAATLPTAFMTAYYGLKTLANLRAGERVLIHAAAGGVGQAAVQLAQHVGAEIFATASQGKWDLLKSQGVCHVMNSRSLDYVEHIKALTAGEGVDVVLNSLAGEFIARNLEILRPEGRYVELGKLGILSQDAMRALMPSAAYLPFDLLEIALESPQSIRTLCSQIQADLQAGLIKPLPLKTFPIQDVVHAFRYMAQAKHIGKVVLNFSQEQQTDPAVVGDGTLRNLPKQPAKWSTETPYIAKSDAGYLITGGLGALGLMVAYWLAMRGARYLILTGRSGMGNTEAQGAVNLLEQSGAKVLVVKADISKQEDAARLFAEMEAASPPLKGVVHAAGVVDDETLTRQTWERFENVMAPKVGGLWNLHRHTQGLDLDFFIAFSSIASLLGSPGHGNYAAANAYLDGLMHYRHRKGLPGLSINWGPWAQAGMAARMDDRSKLGQSAMGLRPLQPVLGLHALEVSLQLDTAQAAVMLIDWGQFFRQFPFANKVPLLETFTPRTGTGADVYGELLARLKVAPANERKGMMLEHVRSELARILGLSSPQQIEIQHRLLDFGLDSLTAIELISTLEISLGTTLPATMLFNHPTIGSLIDYILDGVLKLGTSPPRDSAKQSDNKELELPLVATEPLGMT